METSRVLGELRAKIAANRKELEEQERALVVLERMMHSPTTPPQQSGAISGELFTPKLVMSGTTERAKVSQKEIVLSAIGSMDGREFTVTMIDEALKASGNGFDGGNPRNRISVLLGQLVDDKFIKQTYKGGGNVPHRYQKT